MRTACCAAQVRSTGPINTQTHQPIKGRKFGGGIRFGEMERDALLVSTARGPGPYNCLWTPG